MSSTNSDHIHPDDRQIVPYEPQVHHTRSQSTRLQKAAEGDLSARLSLLDSVAVEKALATTFREACPSVSLLSYIQQPESGRTKADAVKDVLEGLGDQTEDVAETTALVWKYACDNRLWETHTNPAMRSEDAFLSNLEHTWNIRVNLVIATSTYATKRSSLKLIEAGWGSDWYEQIPASIRPPVRPQDATKRLLFQFGALCKAGRTLNEIGPLLVEAVRKRTDPAHRRKTGCTSSLDAFVIASDLEPLTRHWNDSERGRRTLESYFPEVREDRLEFRPLKDPPTAPASVQSVMAPKRKRKDATLPRSKRIRRPKTPNLVTSQAADEGVEDEGTEEDEQEDEQEDGPEEEHATRKGNVECDGLAAGRILTEAIKSLATLEPHHRCCEVSDKSRR